jgi:hypothetical protein
LTIYRELQYNDISVIVNNSTHSQKWWVLCSFAYLRWRRQDVCNFHMIYTDDIIHNCMCVIFFILYWKWNIKKFLKKSRSGKKLIGLAKLFYLQDPMSDRNFFLSATLPVSCISYWWRVTQNLTMNDIWRHIFWN